MLFRHEAKTSALHYAAYEGHKPVALSLLENGAEVDMQDIKGKTALMFATVSSSQAMVQLLLESGANPNIMDLAGNSPLRIAAITGNVTIARLLMANGADIGERLKDRGHVGTALHEATKHSCVTSTRLLLNCNADVNSADVEIPPLHTAALCGNTAIVKLLIDNKAYIDARCKRGGYKGWTALHLAVLRDRLEVAQLLLLNNADVKARRGRAGDYDGTPLQMAIRWKNKEMIDLLTAKEAEIDEEQARHPTSTRVNSTEEAELEPSFTDSCVDSNGLQGDNEEDVSWITCRDRWDTLTTFGVAPELFTDTGHETAEIGEEGMIRSVDAAQWWEN
jgi:ankyrin repeat protein